MPSNVLYPSHFCGSFSTCSSLQSKRLASLILFMGLTFFNLGKYHLGAQAQWKIFHLLLYVAQTLWALRAAPFLVTITFCVSGLSVLPVRASSAHRKEKHLWRWGIGYQHPYKPRCKEWSSLRAFEVSVALSLPQYWSVHIKHILKILDLNLLTMRE